MKFSAIDEKRVTQKTGLWLMAGVSLLPEPGYLSGKYRAIIEAQLPLYTSGIFGVVGEISGNLYFFWV